MRGDAGKARRAAGLTIRRGPRASAAGTSGTTPRGTAGAATADDQRIGVDRGRRHMMIVAGPGRGPGDPAHALSPLDQCSPGGIRERKIVAPTAIGIDGVEVAGHALGIGLRGQNVGRGGDVIIAAAGSGVQVRREDRSIRVPTSPRGIGIAVGRIRHVMGAVVLQYRTRGGRPTGAVCPRRRDVQQQIIIVRITGTAAGMEMRARGRNLALAG